MRCRHVGEDRGQVAVGSRLREIVHELVEPGVVEVDGVAEDQVAQLHLQHLLRGLEEHAEVKLLEVHLFVQLQARRRVLRLQLFVRVGLLRLLVRVGVLRLSLAPQEGDRANEELEVVVAAVVEDDWHFARLRDSAVAGAAKGLDVLTGPVSVVEDLPFARTPFDEGLVTSGALGSGLVVFFQSR